MEQKLWKTSFEAVGYFLLAYPVNLAAVALFKVALQF